MDATEPTAEPSTHPCAGLPPEPDGAPAAGPAAAHRRPRSPGLPAAGDRDGAVGFVTDHLADLVADEPMASPRFRGGQIAADAALATLDVAGYAAERNEVWPERRRGASAVSPYVRHGLLSLPVLWDAVAGAPARDRDKYRDELLWQEYARHLYARLGRDTAAGLRRELPATTSTRSSRTAAAGVGAGPAGVGAGPAGVGAGPAGMAGTPWDTSMACLEQVTSELVRDGYAVNQTRMWLASHWAVRAGWEWRDGEDLLYRHLLDGSRAANRAGWQWTVGTATNRVYGFSRWQVERRAPGLCATCPLADSCPIEEWPEDPHLAPTAQPAALRRDPDPDATAGPTTPLVTGEPTAVWLTAESLGDDDPALAAHPDLPAVFVFDAPLLARLQLSGKRLVFLTETLAELSARRDVEVVVGDPVEVLAGRALAATFAPVPGWRRRAATLAPVAVHPWPWLRRPHAGTLSSFSAWRKLLGQRHG